MPKNKDDIAIIGMDCRFPGAADVREFWRNLREGIDCIRSFRREDLEANLQYASDPNLILSRGLLDDISGFDADFFQMSTQEALLTDPQVRLLLECTWNALESAGYDPSRFPGKIAYYAAARASDYYFHVRAHASTQSELLNTEARNHLFSLCPFISYKLNLRGESIPIQTACSASLVAVHLACESLRHGNSDMALAGAAHIWLPQNYGMVYEEAGVLSPDGKTRTFDQDANGFGVGQGVATVLLKRLPDALAHGDSIIAVIKATAVNHDGKRKIGFTAPSVSGQSEVIREALAHAGVDPERIGYIEAHGSATNLGDPVEITALKKAFGKTSKLKYCAVGSVKSNLGHAGEAAGIAGLIKAALALQHREIPPSLHFKTPNPALALDKSPFYVPTQAKAWGAENRIAGVTSLGLTGTNAHAVLAEAPSIGPSGHRYSPILLTLSARTSEALQKQRTNLAHHLSENPGLDLRDMAYTLNVGRQTFSQRWACLFREREDLLQALEHGDGDVLSGAVSQSGELPHLPKYRVDQSNEKELLELARSWVAGALLDWEQFYHGLKHRRVPLPTYPFERKSYWLGAKASTSFSPVQSHEPVVFVYPGFTGKIELDIPSLSVKAPVFGQTFEECDRIIQSLLGISLHGEGFHPPGAVDPIFFRSALLNFCIQVALTELWRSWNIHPAAVIGHSMGEVAACYAAGILDLESAVTLFIRRTQLLDRTVGKGMMLTTGLSCQTAAQLTARLEGAWVACSNGPNTTVLAGTSERLAEIERTLSSKGIYARIVPHNRIPFHSPLLQHDIEQDKAWLEPKALQERRCPIFSSVTMDPEDTATFNTEYWYDNVMKPVMFHGTLEKIIRSGYQNFLEISHRPILSPMIDETLILAKRPGYAAWSMDDEDDPMTCLLKAKSIIYKGPDRSSGEKVDIETLKRDPEKLIAFMTELLTSSLGLRKLDIPAPDAPFVEAVESAMLLMFLGKLNQAIHTRLTPGILLEARTLENLARRIQGVDGPGQILVPFNEPEPLKPAAIIFPSAGTSAIPMVRWKKIERLNDFNLLCIDTIRDDPRTGQPLEYGKIIDLYTSQIMEQSSSPVLLGYSLGGLIALYAAERLLEKGAKPRHVIMVSAPSPKTLRESPELNNRDLLTEMMIEEGLVTNLAQLRLIIAAARRDLDLVRSYSSPLQRIREVPVSILLSPEDEYYRQTMLEEWKSVAPHAQFLSAQGGHFKFLDRPSNLELINGILSPILDGKTKQAA